MGIFGIIGGLLMLFGWIRATWKAFVNDGALWGLGCLLIPIVVFVYLWKGWPATKEAAQLLAVGFALQMLEAFLL